MPSDQSILDYLDAVTETWVGFALPPVQRAIDDAQWVVDARSNYCHKCGESVGQGETTMTGCGACRGSRPPWKSFVRLGRYKGDLRDWILTIKYDRWYDMAAHLGAKLGESVRACAPVPADRAVVIPMPMPWQRRIYRGIDHARLIADAVGNMLAAPVWSVLAKSNGPPQANMMSRTARVENMRNRMRMKRGIQQDALSGLHAILVDDIRTTGTSLKVAARLVRAFKPASLTVAVLAVSDESPSAVRRSPDMAVTTG